MVRKLQIMRVNLIRDCLVERKKQQKRKDREKGDKVLIKTKKERNETEEEETGETSMG